MSEVTYKHLNEHQRAVVKSIARRGLRGAYRHMVLDEIGGQEGRGLGQKRAAVGRSINAMIRDNLITQKGSLLSLREDVLKDAYKEESELSDAKIIPVFTAYSNKNGKLRLLGIRETRAEVEKLGSPNMLFNGREMLVREDKAVKIGELYYLLDHRNPGPHSLVG